MRINNFKKKLSIIFFSFLFSINTIIAEELNFDIVHKNEIYEIRYYSEHLVAQTIDNNDSGSFRKLFDYISGANNSLEKIEMTTPVTQIKQDNIFFMHFHLPSKFNKKTAPIPSNLNVKIITIKEGYFAVLRFSGRSSDKNFKKNSKILYEKLVEDKILINGFMIKATYNPPFTLPSFRRNEVMFNVLWKSSTQ